MSKMIDKGKFRKKPVVIQAIRWMPDKMLLHDILKFFGGLKGMGARWIAKKQNDLIITTLEGKMTASPGDWIIRGVHGELYPCKPDIFEKTYDLVEEDTTND